MQNKFLSKSVPRGTRTIWRYLGALFILFTFAVGNVMAEDVTWEGPYGNFVSKKLSDNKTEITVTKDGSNSSKTISCIKAGKQAYQSINGGGKYLKFAAPSGYTITRIQMVWMSGAAGQALPVLFGESISAVGTVQSKDKAVSITNGGFTMTSAIATNGGNTCDNPEDIALPAGTRQVMIGRSGAYSSANYTIGEVEETVNFRLAGVSGSYFTTPVGAESTPFIGRVTLTVVPEGYSITYHCNGATSGCPSDVASGATALPSPLATPAKTGYNFDKWYTDEGLTTPAKAGVALSANANLYAGWTAHTHSLTWNIPGDATITNSETYTRGTVAYGTAIVAPTLSREGYDFLGWDVTPAATMPDNDLTYTAKWQDAAAKHSITYADYGSADISGYPTEYSEGIGIASFAPLADTEDQHFLGWDPATIAASATTDQTITATWEAKKVVSFNTGLGSAIADVKVVSGEAVAAPTAPTRLNWTFQKWQKEGVDYDFATPVTEDITLDAVWSRDEISGTPTDIVLVSTSAAIGSTSPLTDVYYGNAEWTYTGNAKISTGGAMFSTPNAKKWVGFTLPSGYVATVTANSTNSNERHCVLVTEADRAGIAGDATFLLDITTNSSTTTATSSSFGAGSYALGSTSGGIDINSVVVHVSEAPIMVTFKTGEATYAAISATSGEKLGNLFLNGELPSGLEVPGYTFNGWADVTKETVITASMTVQADLTPEVYNVTLDKGVYGSVDGAATVGLGDAALTISSAATAPAGYTLLGYFIAADGETKVAEADGSFVDETIAGYIAAGKWNNAGDATLYAHWQDNSAVAKIGTTMYANLAEALAHAEDGEIVLLQDIDVTSQLEIAAGVTATIDLNGHKIEYVGDATLPSGVILVHNGASLTINDSSDPDAGSIVSGDKAYAAVALTKLGDDASTPATLVVNGGALTGYYYGITGNGSRNNTDITINGGTITGTEGIAIYHPQVGTLTVNNGSLTGVDAAIEMRAGTLVINDGTFTATATEFSCNPNGSGSTTTGAAIAIAQHTTKKEISVTINGGTFNGVKAINESNPQVNDPAPAVAMEVTGGDFTGAVTTADVNNFISGGTFSEQLTADQCAPGMVPTEANAQGKYSVEPKQPLCLVKGNVTDNAIALDEAVSYLTASQVTLQNYKVNGRDNTSIDGSKFQKTAYLKIELPEGESFKVGDIVDLEVAAFSNESHKLLVYAAYDGGDNVETGDNLLVDEATVPALAVGHVQVALSKASRTLYLVRDNNNGWNPHVRSVAVYRAYPQPVLEAISINGVAGVKGEGNAFSVKLPANADVAALTVTEKVMSNDPEHTHGAIQGAWAIGANTYRVTDADGDYADYTITLAQAAAIDHVEVSGTPSVNETASTTLTATVYDVNNEVAEIQDVTWSTANAAIATVENGVVTGVLPGTVEITATSVADNTKKATVTVTVNELACRVWNAPAGEFTDPATVGKLTITKGTSGEIAQVVLHKNGNADVKGYTFKVGGNSAYCEMYYTDGAQFESLELGVSSNTTNEDVYKYVVVASSAKTFDASKVLSAVEYDANHKDATEAVHTAITLPEGTRNVRIYRSYDNKGSEKSMHVYYVSACKKELVPVTAVTVANAKLGKGNSMNLAVATITPATADIASYTWSIESSTATGVTLEGNVLTAATEAAEGNVVVKVVAKDALNNEVEATATITIVNKFEALKPVAATQVWDWTPVAVEKDGPTITAPDTVLANYLGGEEWEMLAGNAGGSPYRSTTYKAYQGTSLSFEAAVPGMLIMYAGRTSSDKDVFVNGTKVGTVKSQKAYMDTIAVPAGLVRITSESMRIYWMKFDTAFSKYEITDNKLAGYTRDVTEGRYGTICLPKKGVMTGATLYEVAYYGATSKKIFFDEVLNGEMQAGVPYIFLPNEGADKLAVFYTDDAVETAKSANGLVGFIGANEEDAQEVPVGSYILSNNQYRKVVYAESAYIKSNRSYINLSAINPSEPTLAPGRRRISMSVQGEQTATDIDNIFGNDTKAEKVLINGQLFILRGGKMFDAAGQLVK